MKGYSLQGFRGGIRPLVDKERGLMLERLQEDPNALSTFSFGMLDRNEWAAAEGIRVLDPWVLLHQWVPPEPPGIMEALVLVCECAGGEVHVCD